MSAGTKDNLIKKYFTARYIADKSILRYEIFCQAIQLAVEQIQEVEISILKKKQETKIETVLTDFFILYFLEAKIAGAIVKGMSQKFVDSFYRVRFLNKHFAENIVKHMDHNLLLKKVSKEVAASEKNIESIEKIVTDALQTGAKMAEKKAYSKSAPSRHDDIIEKGTGNWIDAFEEKKIRPFVPEFEKNPGYSPNVAKGFPVTQGADSPSVAVMRSAYSQYIEFKESVNSALIMVFEEIMLLIVSDDDSLAPDLESVLDDIINEDKQEQNETIDYDKVRDHLSLEIEKLIWVALYGASMDMIIPRASDINQVRDAGVIKGVDPDDNLSLQNYWWARFPDPDTSLPFPNKYKMFAHFKEVYLYLEEYGIDQVVKLQ